MPSLVVHDVYDKWADILFYCQGIIVISSFRRGQRHSLQILGPGDSHDSSGAFGFYYHEQRQAKTH